MKVAALVAVVLPNVLLSSANSNQLLGVHPSLADKYLPIKSKNTWKCLEGTTEIPFSALNDDYCDCPDGSDEPGTGACPNTTFYCANIGHIGAVIPSSRVRDGLCEPECCDGSDESVAVCPDTCQAAGEEQRKRLAALNKIRKTGSKIRSTYLAFAQKEKTRLEKAISTLESDIALKEREVERLRDTRDRFETISAAETELKKQSPLYQSLQSHKNALKSFRRLHEKLKKRDETLRDILTGLRDGYNPNYQDMAVLEAVRGWETLESLPAKGSSEDGTDQDSNKSEDPVETEELEEGAWTDGQLEHQLGGLIDQDYMALLLSHESYIDEMHNPSYILDLASYVPDAWLPSFVSLRNQLLGTLRSIGFVRGNGQTAEQATQAAKDFTDAEEALRNMVTDKEEAVTELNELFDVEHMGSQGEWKKLDGTCIETDTGEYIYEVCFFDKATQKGKTGGHHSLGQFESWNTDVSSADEKYYTKQLYKHGAQCWNGPQRSVTLELKCGVENALHVVSEPEKCEYHITGETPALCLPLPITNDAKPDL